MSGSCVTTMIVMPSSRFSRWKIAMISRPVRESSAPVGSSARMIRGIVDERPGDRHALLLSAGQLAGLVILAPRQADREQRLLRPLAPLARQAMSVYSSGNSTFSAALVRASRLNC